MTHPYPQGPYGPQDPYNQGGGNPQDPYNQGGGYQPDPYNQGGYPQTGGFPQQGYPQQGGGYPQQGGGYPPGPPAGPPKSNTTMIVSIVAVVVLVLGALGITGFVAPGFFLADDKKDSENGNGGGPASGPQALAQEIVAALNAKDSAKLTSLKCSNADEDVDQVIAQAPQVESATLGEVKKADNANPPEGVGEVWSAQVTVIVSGQSMQAEGLMAQVDGKWCWGDVDLGGSLPGSSSSPSTVPPATGAPPPIDTSGGPATGGSTGGYASTMSDFVSKVNAKDSSGAMGLVCSANTSTVSSNVDTAISGSASVSQDGTPNDSTITTTVDLTGTLNGSSAQGLLGAKSDDNGATWCIDYFSFY